MVVGSLTPSVRGDHGPIVAGASGAKQPLLRTGDRQREASRDLEIVETIEHSNRFLQNVRRVSTDMSPGVVTELEPIRNALIDAGFTPGEMRLQLKD